MPRIEKARGPSAAAREGDRGTKMKGGRDQKFNTEEIPNGRNKNSLL